MFQVDRKPNPIPDERITTSSETSLMSDRNPQRIRNNSDMNWIVPIYAWETSNVNTVLKSQEMSEIYLVLLFVKFRVKFSGVCYLSESEILELFNCYLLLL